MNVVGKKVVLRAFEEADLAALQRWANDPDLQGLLVGWHFPVSLADQRRWFEKLDVFSSDRKFGIELPGEGLVGTANLGPIDWVNGTAYHGMLLGDPKFRGKGIALDTVMTMLRYAFDELRLYRVECDFVDYNERSKSFYLTKCGFREEGRRTEAFYRRGRRWDKVLAGITRPQYLEHVKRTEYWNE